jgi:hypothetical protein
MSVRVFPALLVGALSVVCVSPALAQRSALTYPRNIGELTAQAATIVRGHVVSARLAPDPQLKNLTTVVVAVRVQEVLKGQSGPLFTFRQFVWDLHSKYDAGGYRKGQEVLLLMNAPSQYGLSSPAGMEQGRFLIQPERDGRRIAVNGQGNAGLFRNLSALASQKGVTLSRRAATLVAQHRAGPVRVEDLEEIVKTFAGVR